MFVSRVRDRDDSTDGVARAVRRSVGATLAGAGGGAPREVGR